jgi:hypothetical protein
MGLSLTATCFIQTGEENEAAVGVIGDWRHPLVLRSVPFKAVGGTIGETFTITHPRPMRSSHRFTGGRYKLRSRISDGDRCQSISAGYSIYRVAALGSRFFAAETRRCWVCDGSFSAATRENCLPNLV